MTVQKPTAYDVSIGVERITRARVILSTARAALNDILHDPILARDQKDTALSDIRGMMRGFDGWEDVLIREQRDLVGEAMAAEK